MTSSSTASAAPSNIDGLVNAGNPFLLTLPSPPPLTRRSLRARSPPALYLLANGSTTANPALAAVFNITSGGELQTSSPGGSDMFYSTEHGSPPRCPRPRCDGQSGPDHEDVLCAEWGVVWVSQWFGNGTAAFYMLPDGEGGYVVWVQFSGPIDAPGADFLAGAEAWV